MTFRHLPTVNRTEFDSLTDPAALAGAAATGALWDQVVIDAVTTSERDGPAAVFRPRACGPCSFPVCEPGRFYCDAESLPGRSYCLAHHKLTHRNSRKW